MPATQHFDVIILGAGAAGLMCALTAGQRGRRVLLLDHADKVGAKILISGGGRCNFTNLDVRPTCFVSDNPHFCKSALARYTQHDFIGLIERHGIAYHEKTLGQLFCDGSARQIVAMLLDECARGTVDVCTGHSITDIDRPDNFRVATSRGTITADNLVLATGGPSIPKMGATGFAYDIARQFGLHVLQPHPALVPLTVDGPLLEFCRPLAGVAFDAIASCAEVHFREAMLFTHRGLSGPAILQISSYWDGKASVTLDLAPGQDVAALIKDRKRTRPKIELHTALGDVLPARAAQAFAATLNAAGPVGTLRDATIDNMAAQLHAWQITPSGTEGFAKAEVTAGGIDTAALSSKTMEAKSVPGLYCIGEAVDVTGWLGGYNFQWAWSSGWCAGMAV
jgi:predicted Rossmann fold flavoprotein